ncbi:MAG: hypothetical protein KKA62_01905 [Nanoarchaeota archaeon]|nr:hypothetical protein [Nanoarchaeota archaeon]MBU1644564.1 hypothetical protein [Nanoarchaeota archaeon]MBU1976688.1 hypothetical protein [Nanoarchaeota archaeon]
MRKSLYSFFTAPILAISIANQGCVLDRDGLDEELTQGPIDKRVTLAECLVDKEARLYSAWWCAPCSLQKELFGEEAVHVLKEGGVYNDCYPLGKKEPINQICIDKNIKLLPTWDFKKWDPVTKKEEIFRVTGVYYLDYIAQLSGCNYNPNPEDQDNINLDD